MTVVCRKYTPNDYDRAIEFFRELYRESRDVPQWLPIRWEYAEYLVSPLMKDRGTTIDWKETIYLWETDAGEIVAVLCSENPDENMFIHTKPEYRYLEEEMVDVAEKRVISDTLKKSRTIIWCRFGDSFRESLLQRRSYRKQEGEEYLVWRDMDKPLPEVRIPDEFTLHNMVSEEGLDLQRKIDRMTGAFESKTYPVEIYRNMQRGPSYRKDFDLYTTDSDGNVTSFCIIWYDKELKIADFEPVGTDASQRRKGLGRATLNAGLKILKQAGATRAYAGTSGDDRKSFYYASGFTDNVVFHPWMKELDE